MGHQRLTVARRKQINKEQTTLITLNSLIEMAAVKLAVLPAFAKNWKPGDYEVVGEVLTTLNAARKNKEFQAVIRKARRRAPLDVP